MPYIAKYRLLNNHAFFRPVGRQRTWDGYTPTPQAFGGSRTSIGSRDAAEREWGLRVYSSPRLPFPLLSEVSSQLTEAGRKLSQLLSVLLVSRKLFLVDAI